MASKNEPLRIFDGTAQPHQPFWTARNADESKSGEPELEMYGYISEYSWFGDDITPAQFKADLERIGNGGPVTVRIHSGGGDVFAASVIRATLMDYPGRVTVRIDGLCASAATFVAMAGDRVVMQDTGFFMIHDPMAMAFGNVDELKAVIDFLKTIKAGIVDAYQVKTQLDVERISKMMSDETWMSANEARELGFVDEVISARAGKLPKNMAVMNALAHFANVPAALLVEGETSAPVVDPALERFRAAVKILRERK